MNGTRRNLMRDFSLYEGAICLLAFSIPVIKYGIQIPIILLVIAWLFAKKQVDKKVLIPILLFAAIYIFHLIAMLYTENVDRGSKDLVQKLSLILFPVIIGTGPKLSEKMRATGMKFFVLGTLTAVLFAFVSSAIAYSSSGIISEFYMSSFSPSHHPSYISFYVVIALAILLLRIEKNTESKKAPPLWLAVLFLSLTLIFPASKMGFINWSMVAFIFLLKWLILKPRHRKSALLLLGVGLLFFLFMKFDPVASARIGKAVEVTSQIDQPSNESQIESNTARLYSWSTSLMLIKENPIGVGTGDINDAMVSAYRKQGLDDLAAKSLNPHNEFLQIAVAIGIPAALVFLFSLVYPFGKIFREKDWIYGIFLLSIFMQFSVESMLEKQSGVIFFAFFNAFFFFSPKSLKWG
ncbi:O-antigen ligase family protein [Cryomorphaceae bacterium 1068]|nr:O-antigen ligase family protein [Cryomorphaceae bacterium 1068]